MGAGSPVHAAVAVSISDSRGMPATAGPFVNAGFAWAPDDAGAKSPMKTATAVEMTPFMRGRSSVSRELGSRRSPSRTAWIVRLTTAHLSSTSPETSSNRSRRQAGETEARLRDRRARSQQAIAPRTGDLHPELPKRGHSHARGALQRQARRSFSHILGKGLQRSLLGRAADELRSNFEHRQSRPYPAHAPKASGAARTTCRRAGSSMARRHNSLARRFVTGTPARPRGSGCRARRSPQVTLIGASSLSMPATAPVGFRA